MEYYSAIKIKAFESVPMRQMNLECIMQTEVSQKSKYILMHVYGIQKDGTDEAICRAAMERQAQRTDMDKSRGEEEEGEMNGESSMEAYILQYTKQIDDGNLLQDSGNSN